MLNAASARTANSFWILFAAFVCACSTACVNRFAATEEVEFYEIIFVRFSYIFLFSCLWLINKKESFRTKQVKIHIGRFIFGGAAACCVTVGDMHLPISVSQTCMYTSPLFLTALSFIFGDRRYIVPFVALILTAFAGICIITQPGNIGDVSLFYICVGISGGAFIACSSYALKKLGDEKEPVARSVMYFSGFCAFAAFVMSVIDGGTIHLRYFLDPYMLVLVLIAGTLQYARTLGWGKGHLYLNSVFSMMGIPFACIIGFVFFDQSLSFASLTGISLILMSSFLSFFLRIRMNKDVKVGADIHRVKSIPKSAVNPTFNSAETVH